MMCGDGGGDRAGRKRDVTFPGNFTSSLALYSMARFSYSYRPFFAVPFWKHIFFVLILYRKQDIHHIYAYICVRVIDLNLIYRYTYTKVNVVVFWHSSKDVASVPDDKIQSQQFSFRIKWCFVCVCVFWIWFEKGHQFKEFPETLLINWESWHWKPNTEDHFLIKAINSPHTQKTTNRT